MPVEPIHISFIRELQGAAQTPNILDQLAVDIGRIDSNENDITGSEIQAASRDARFKKIFEHISAKDLFRDLRSFAVARGVVFAKEQKLNATDAIWLSENLFFGNHKGSNVGDLVGALYYAGFAPRPGKTIDDRSLLSGDSKLFDYFPAVAEKLETKDIIPLLTKHKLFTKDAKKKGILPILDELAKRNSRSREAADALVEILQGDVRTVLKTLAVGILDDVNTLRSTFSLNYSVDQISEGKESTTDFLKKIEKDLPVGAKIARRIKDVAILNTKNIDALASIMQDKGHEALTKISIAEALGKAEYVDEAARSHAADRLVSYLEKVDPCDWQNTKTSVIVFESVISLGQLGVYRTKDHDICKLLLNYLTDMRHPELQLAAAVAFGFLGSKMPPDTKGQRTVIDYLTNALGDGSDGDDNEAEAVRKAADAALHMVENHLQ